MKRLTFIVAAVVTLLAATTIIARPIHVGDVSLSRDGCGDIKASVVAYEGLRSHIGLTITNVTTSTTVYASGVVFQHSLTSPIFAGYGGVGISVTGTLYDFTPPLSATTTPDYGT
jgi:hypothetical protein